MVSPMWIVEGCDKHFTTEEEAKNKAEELAYLWLADQLCPKIEQEICGYNSYTGTTHIVAKVRSIVIIKEETITKAYKEYEKKCKAFSKFIIENK